MPPIQAAFYHLGVALAIGLLIGIERGWSERDEVEGIRIAGVRTFALIGLLGGASALLVQPFGWVVAAVGLLGLAGLFATAQVLHARARPDQIGITVPVAGLLTFVLGALAASGEVALAGAAAVIAALLLSSKPCLHRWLGTLRRRELGAALQLLLLSVVILPLLPDQGFGPWQTLNPRRIWWMVFLIGVLSFAGYFALKEAGARKGAVYTGLFAGLASSTGLTLYFSRLTRNQPELAPALATGILLACGTMFPRLAVIMAVIAPDLVVQALLPLGLMSLVVYGSALRQWWVGDDQQGKPATPVAKPLDLPAAIGFGAILAMVTMLAKAAELWFGSAGVLALAAASGIADVDAITLSLAGMSHSGLDPRTVVTGVLVAAAANSLAKGSMAAVIGGRYLGLVVALPLGVAAICGPVAAWLILW